MDITTTMLLIVGTFNLFLGAAIFIHGPKKRNDISYAVLVGMLIFWIVDIIILRSTDVPSTALLALAASHIAGIGIAISFWYFVEFFTEQKRNIGAEIIIWVTGLAIGFLAVTSRSFTVDIINNGSYNKTLILGPLHFLFLAYFTLVMGHAFYKLFVAYNNTNDSQRRSQFAAVFGGTLLTTVIGSVCNIFLLRFGISDYIGIGPLATIAMVAFITYAIMRYNLMSIKVISAEFFALTLILVLAIRLILSQGITESVVNAISLIFAIFFGLFLIRAVVKEVEQREKLESLTKELESANEKLKELDHLKSEFLSFASHQIKAPLAAIKGFASLIADGSYGEVSDKVKDAATKIKDSVDRMVKLVSDSLNLRKIEEGRMEYKFARINAVELVQNIFDELKTLAQKKNLEFAIEAIPGGGWINADVQNLRQVFQNLIENAIKYTDSGFVKVRTESSAGSFIFSVSDSGHGISKELLPHLFEEFRRDNKEKQIEGTGLGLYIAHEITTAHGGEIWAESDGRGTGTKFIVKIPLA